MNNETQLVFNSRIDNIAQVEQLIEQIKTTYNIQDEIYGNLLLASIEAVNNAIEHGNQFDSDKQVKFKAQVSETNIIIKVQDEGAGFDANTLPDPTTTERRELPDGRGVFLMRKLADTIQFKKGGTMVEMEFYL